MKTERKKVKERVDWVKYWEELNEKEWEIQEVSIRLILKQIKNLSIDMFWVIIEITFDIIDMICDFIVILIIVTILILILIPIAKAF